MGDGEDSCVVVVGGGEPGEAVWAGFDGMNLYVLPEAGSTSIRAGRFYEKPFGCSLSTNH